MVKSVLRRALTEKIPNAANNLGSEKLAEIIAALRENSDPSESERLMSQLGLSAKDVRLMSDEAFPSGRRQGRVCLRDLRTAAVLGLDDVGAGISQVVPVLVYAAAIQSGLCAIAQPELHLHPRLQCDIMDYLLNSAQGVKPVLDLPEGWIDAVLDGKECIPDPEYLARKSRREYIISTGSFAYEGPRFILETHSESMILRLMRRLRETAEGTLPDGMHGVRPEHVAILYVEPHEHGSIVHELELSEDGRLLDPWPGGFFDEGFEERFGD
jgi:hypothetical protein